MKILRRPEESTITLAFGKYRETDHHCRDCRGGDYGEEVGWCMFSLRIRMKADVNQKRNLEEQVSSIDELVSRRTLRAAIYAFRH